jgi:hypothetical protein
MTRGASMNIYQPPSTNPQFTLFPFSKRRRRRRSCSSLGFVDPYLPYIPTPSLHFFHFEKEKEKEKLFIYKVIYQYLPAPLYHNPQFTLFEFSKRRRRRRSCSSLGFVDPYLPSIPNPQFTLFPFSKRRRRRRSCSSLGFIDPYLPSIPTPSLHFLNFRKGEGEGEGEVAHL